ncbi:hypothetical protein [Streptomyces lichenis]|uniref:Uncharacterized protein n=1 Tax=Streptomyces lichenis TaxID=2306967 RepID=A0ABT0I3X3_9ACTN|nr:hypothetical protein [Streptomyces lichenis]MCK8676021.1 hypothetical protein [Streptomyces lichenis]
MARGATRRAGAPERRRGRFRFSPLLLAGWLFADMLLVLTLVSMGDQGDPRAVAAAVSPSPSATGREKPPPSPSPKPSGPRSVERKPVKIGLAAAPSDTDRMVAELRSATARHQGRTAAIVLTFGQATDPGAGQDYAGEVNDALRRARPDMFGTATTRDFWNGGPSGRADLEIYFYTR